jgi:hypothetical protein
MAHKGVIKERRAKYPPTIPTLHKCLSETVTVFLILK